MNSSGSLRSAPAHYSAPTRLQNKSNQSEGSQRTNSSSSFTASTGPVRAGKTSSYEFSGADSHGDSFSYLGSRTDYDDQRALAKQSRAIQRNPLQNELVENSLNDARSTRSRGSQSTAGEDSSFSDDVTLTRRDADGAQSEAPVVGPQTFTERKKAQEMGEGARLNGRRSRISSPNAQARLGHAEQIEAKANQAQLQPAQSWGHRTFELNLKHAHHQPDANRSYIHTMVDGLKALSKCKTQEDVLASRHFDEFSTLVDAMYPSDTDSGMADDPYLEPAAHVQSDPDMAKEFAISTESDATRSDQTLDGDSESTSHSNLRLGVDLDAKPSLAPNPASKAAFTASFLKGMVEAIEVFEKQHTAVTQRHHTPSDKSQWAAQMLGQDPDWDDADRSKVDAAQLDSTHADDAQPVTPEPSSDNTARLLKWLSRLTESERDRLKQLASA